MCSWIYVLSAVAYYSGMHTCLTFGAEYPGGGGWASCGWLPGSLLYGSCCSSDGGAGEVNDSGFLPRLQQPHSLRRLAIPISYDFTHKSICWKQPRDRHQDQSWHPCDGLFLCMLLAVPISCGFSYRLFFGSSQRIPHQAMVLPIASSKPWRCTWRKQDYQLLAIQDMPPKRMSSQEAHRSGKAAVVLGKRLLPWAAVHVRAFSSTALEERGRVGSHMLCVGQPLCRAHEKFASFAYSPPALTRHIQLQRGFDPLLR